MVSYLIDMQPSVGVNYVTQLLKYN